MSETSVTMSEPQNNNRQSDAEAQRIARRRSIAIAVSLVVLVAIFYAATIVRMGGAVANKTW